VAIQDKIRVTDDVAREAPKSIDQMTSDEIENWVMPTVSLGQPVIFYPDGTPIKRSGRPLALGFVTQKGRRSITLRMPDGTAKMGVRHVGDPKLQMGAGDQRENGAWDFTDYDRGQVIQKLQDEMAKLRSDVDSLLAPKATQK
jgi:hypothetical protein